MQAIQFTRYGPPTVLHQVDVPVPQPTADQILVKIHAASVNPLDWHRMRAAPFLARLSEGFFKPSDPRLGADLAGVVESVGANITQFKPGDRVFGEIGAGAFAEYAVATPKSLAHIPATVSFETAAAVPVAGLTALQMLHKVGQLQRGQHVLINGASGGIGTLAVQLAKAAGAHVTAVTSTRNLDLVRRLGADDVLDYTTTDFTRTGPYDLVADTIGNHAMPALLRAVVPGGICSVAGFSTLPKLFQIMLFGPFMPRLANKTIRIFTAERNPADFAILAQHLESGALTPVIDRRFPLAQTAEAIAYVETKRARGKVIITLPTA